MSDGPRHPSLTLPRTVTLPDGAAEFALTLLEPATGDGARNRPAGSGGTGILPVLALHRQDACATKADTIIRAVSKMNGAGRLNGASNGACCYPRRGIRWANKR